MTDASTQPAVSVDPHDEITNLSDNPTFASVVDASLSRRSVLLGTAATALFTSLGGVSTLAISGEAEAATTAKKLLSFKVFGNLYPSTIPLWWQDFMTVWPCSPDLLPTNNGVFDAGNVDAYLASQPVKLTRGA